MKKSWIIFSLKINQLEVLIPSAILHSSILKIILTVFTDSLGSWFFHYNRFLYQFLRYSSMWMIMYTIFFFAFGKNFWHFYWSCFGVTIENSQSILLTLSWGHFEVQRIIWGNRDPKPWQDPYLLYLLTSHVIL